MIEETGMDMRNFINLFEGISDVVSDIGFGMETAAHDHQSDGEESMAMYRSFDDFTKAYFDSILFTEMHSDNPELQHTTIQDFALQTMIKIRNDCRKFQDQVNLHGISLDDACIKSGDYTPEEFAGHDFWLTRNGHGAGFWEDDWEKDQGRQLAQLAHEFGGVDVHMGDDSKVYIT